MHISAKVYSTLITCALLAALFLFSGCDETPTGPEESGPEEMSETGAFTVTTTSDLHLRGLEYCVGDKCKAPDEAGAVRFGELPGGAHEVELTGLSDRCVVEDGNPRAERVTAGDTTAVNFDLKCGDAAMLFVADGPLYEGGPEGGENVLYRAALGASDRTPMVTRASEITRVSSDDRATNAVHISASADGTICWSRSTSPDGDGPSSIFCHLLEGNSTYPITDRGADPAVSADEEWVAFERDGDLFLQSTDGTGEARRLTDTTRVSASDPDFSPDGTEILFAQKAKDAGGDICWSTHILDVETKETRRVGDHCQPFSPDPAYSPDGTEIVTVREDDSGIRNLHVQRTDGSATDGSATGVWITPFEGEGRLDAWANPHWSEDGYIYYLSTSPSKATNHNSSRSNRSDYLDNAGGDTDVIDLDLKVNAMKAFIKVEGMPG